VKLGRRSAAAEGGVVIDRVRRNVLAAGAAATAVAAAPHVLAQKAAPGDLKTGFFERGDVRIRYQEIGSGFPLLAIPGGGLNSRLAVWPNAVINAMEAFKADFRCISMDLRNAGGGESTGPVAVDNPWDAFADDQLRLLDHLGVRKFAYFGNCIGGPFGLKLMERAPDRIVAGVLSQPVGHRPENPDVMYDSGLDTWAPEFRKRQPDVSMATIETYLHNLYRVRPDFVYSVSRDFVRACQTPILVLPDDIAPHPYPVALDVASLAPKADMNVYPWMKPQELKARTIDRARAFFKAHTPATSKA
jgi:pimeloyl-ACP methyl ester carboxylesterase